MMTAGSTNVALTSRRPERVHMRTFVGAHMRSFVRALVTASLTLAGIAPLSALGAQPPRPRVKMRAYPVEVVLDTLVYARDTVRAPMGETFAAVRATYAALKLPREWADSTNGQLGTLRARVTYQLGGERLSVFFNCGNGLTGANADTWRLTIAIVTFLQPAGDGKVRLGTGAVAEAQDMSGVSTEPAMCGSTGLLEARILKDVRGKLGQS